MTDQVDIIVPVYNAFEYTVKCVESIQKNTGGLYGLIIVDDRSSDPRFPAYYENIKKSGNVILLKNETNLGFVASVNKGMRFSKNDVVLLNSDTEVTPGWLDKLKSCVASDRTIATATPFTNSGTICSVPEFCHDNQLPEGFDADRFAALVERISLREYPTIPTGVGFCMFIRREVLSRIGCFDEQAFGKGYGEENDFCYRAIRAGYRNVLCDDAFIYHKGTMSFSEEKKNQYVGKNIELLEKRYPAERRETLRFCSKNPISHLTEHLKVRLAFENGKKNILYVLHMPVPYRDGDSKAGGTQKHVLELALQLKQEFNVFILWPEPDRGLCLIGNSGDGFREMFFSFQNIEGKKEDRILETVLRGFSIDLVHIHHTMYFSTKVFEIAEKCGVPTIFTAHDYYTICPNVTMTREVGQNIQFCGDFGGCGSCCESIEEWRARYRRAIQGCAAVIVPDASVGSYLQKVFPDRTFRVIEHGVNRRSCPDKIQTDVIKADTGLFRIAFVGGVTRHKGSAVVSRLLGLAGEGGPVGSRIEWHFFGYVEDPNLKTGHRNVVMHGPYAGEEITGLLRENKIQLACFFPSWPETYNYVLTECWMAGVPALGFDIGAIGGRIRKTGFGYLLPFGADEQQILQKIGEVMDDRAGLLEIRDRLLGYQPKSIAEMGAEYAALYQEVILKEGKPPAAKADNRMISQAIARAAEGTETMGIAYGARLEAMRERIAKMLPGFISKRILKGQYPFKQQLKRLAARLSGKNGTGKQK